MTDFDINLLRNLVRWVTEEERDFLDFKWDQGSWGRQIKNGSCQTACCVAGAAVVASGYKLDFDDDEWTSDWLVPGVKYRVTETCIDPETRQKLNISETAASLIGLDPVEAEDLFFSENDADDIYALAAGIATDHGYELFPDNEETNA